MIKKHEMHEIHYSLINGQKRQMVEQINDYGLYNFFSDYKYYLDSFNDETYTTKNFIDCVISYHRITNR